MNFLQIKLKNTGQINSVGIENDTDAEKIYDDISNAIIDKVSVRFQVDGVKHTFKAETVDGVALIPSSLIAKRQEEQKKLAEQYQNQTNQLVGAGITSKFVGSPTVGSPTLLGY